MINVKMLLLLVFITMRHGFRFLLPLFQNFHINHSFFKIFIIIRFSSFLCCISRKTVDTEYTYYSWCMTSTDIVKWRKTNDHENFEKGMIYMKILKRGRGSRERGEEETKSMPHAPVVFIVNYMCIRLYGKEDQDGFNELADETPDLG